MDIERKGRQRDSWHITNKERELGRRRIWKDWLVDPPFFINEYERCYDKALLVF